MVAVELLALVCMVSGLAGLHPAALDLMRCALLAGLAVLYAELTSRIESLRRYLSDGARVTLSTVWWLAAVVALPVGLVDVLVVVLYTYGLLRGKHMSTRTYRVVFTTAAVVLACHAASSVMSVAHGAGPGWMAAGIVAACLVFELVNFGLVMVVSGLGRGRGALHEMLRAGDEHLLEIATLCLGAATGVLVIHQLWLSWLALPVMLVLQRSSAVRQLQVQAITDAKTGLLNPTAWQQLAQRQLAQAVRAEQPASLLLVDLDHFKRVNDTHGHLVGDDALRLVAYALGRELRDYDSLGRFGGEEFVAFLPGVDELSAHSIAERLRQQIATLHCEGAPGERVSLSISVGIATYPGHPAQVDELLRAADAALYAAKRNGRNRVELAGPGNGVTSGPRRAARPSASRHAVGASSRR